MILTNFWREVKQIKRPINQWKCFPRFERVNLFVINVQSKTVLKRLDGLQTYITHQI